MHSPAADMGVCSLSPGDVKDTVAGLEERVACGRLLAVDGCRMELTVCAGGECTPSIGGTRPHGGMQLRYRFLRH